MRTLCLLLGIVLAWPAQAAAPGRARLKAVYREALETLGRGDRDGAREAVLALETAAIDGGRPDAIPRMRRYQAKVLEDLLPAGSEAMVPVILLHERVYLGHRQAGRPLLALHARTLAVDLARSYAAHGGDGARSLAGRMLTSLAGHLQAAAVGTVAADLYREALALEPDNPAALSGLAYLREQRGDYSGALLLLEELVARHPEDAEATLRLGINRLRTGALDAAASALESLLGADRPEWVRALAYQELARALVDRGQGERAQRLLLEAVAALPHDSSLVIQLAYLTDREDDPVEVDLQGALERLSDRVSVAPRYRYSRMPVTALERVRRELADREAPQIVTLTRILSDDRRDRVGR